jgi:hypothetical protein
VSASATDKSFAERAFHAALQLAFEQIGLRR